MYMVRWRGKGRSIKLLALCRSGRQPAFWGPVYYIKTIKIFSLLAKRKNAVVQRSTDTGAEHKEENCTEARCLRIAIGLIVYFMLGRGVSTGSYSVA